MLIISLLVNTLHLFTNQRQKEFEMMDEGELHYTFANIILWDRKAWWIILQVKQII
jgi:hypothetical protein